MCINFVENFRGEIVDKIRKVKHAGIKVKLC